MPEPSELSRRERQIMDAVFALGEATVNQVVEAIPSPPTAMAVRRMMHILEEKGHLRRRERGREVIYVPRQTKGKAGRPTSYVFAFRPPTKAFDLRLSLRKSKVDPSEIIEALENIIRELKAARRH